MPKEPTFENALAFAQDLIRIPSLSGKEGEVARRIMQEMKALGFSEIRADDWEMSSAVILGTEGGPP